MNRAGAILLLTLFLSLFPSVEAKTLERMELVSRLGRRASVKIYSGEELTFRAREVRSGFAGIFDSGEFLTGVTFTLRDWPRVKQDAIAIAKGANRRIVREVKPGPELWGMPPSSITIEPGDAGRYLLEGMKSGYRPARVIVHMARFSILVREGSLSERQYTCEFDVSLEDPDEKGRPIPLLVEVIDEDGALIDARDDIRLVAVTGKQHEYLTNRRIRLSSTEAESFRERVKRSARDPLPAGFLDLKAMRIVSGGSVRVSFRNLHAVYPLPLGY